MATEKYEDVIIKGITRFTLELKTKVNLNINALAVDGAKIIYRKPDGAKDEWQATVVTMSNGTIKVEFSITVKCDLEGIWNFWAKLNFLDGTFSVSKAPIKFLCVSEGDIIN